MKKLMSALEETSPVLLFVFAVPVIVIVDAVLHPIAQFFIKVFVH